MAQMDADHKGYTKLHTVIYPNNVINLYEFCSVPSDNVMVYDTRKISELSAQCFE